MKPQAPEMTMGPRELKRLRITNPESRRLVEWYDPGLMRSLADKLRDWLLPAGILLGLRCFIQPIENPDLWWHLSAGRWIVEHRAWPRADFLSHTFGGAKWVDFEWGIQAVYYGLFRAGGALGLLSLKLALIALTVWTTVRVLALHGLGAPARGCRVSG